MKKPGLLAMALCLTMFVAGCAEEKKTDKKGDTKAGAGAKADEKGGTHEPADAAKGDAPKADEPKADEPKADAPKADEPKADEPKADAPK